MRIRWCVFVIVVVMMLGVVPSVGWSAPHEKAPDEAQLRKVAELKERYERLGKEGKYAIAIPLAEQACSILREELIDQQEQLASCLSDQASLRHHHGEYDKARLLYEQALSIDEEVLGPDHLDVAHCLNDLAFTYSVQGEYQKAEALHDRALAIKKKVLGPDHPDVALSLDNLSVLYYRQGEYEKAGALQEKALAIREKALGPNHPDVAKSLNNLASMYEKQGAHGKAESLHERALTILEEALGPNHPDVAIILNNLASLYEIQGAYGKAESFYDRALTIEEKTLGHHHPSVAVSLNNLALLYQKQGAYGKAEPLFERALAIKEEVLGADHLDVATILGNLASLYADQGEYGKAEKLSGRVLAIREKRLGSEHFDVSHSLHNLGTIYYHQGKYREAKPLLERALAIHEARLGPDHDNVATCLDSLAVLYVAQGEYDKVELLLERVLAMRERSLGSDHPEFSNSLHNLASLYSRQGEYKKAGLLYGRAVSIREEALGPDHPDVAMSLNNLAQVYVNQGEHEKALKLHERALIIRERSLGPDHPNVATSLNNLAALYRYQGAYGKAESLYQRALSISETALGSDHPSVANSLRGLAMVFQNQREYGRAKTLEERALGIREKTLGSDHPDVALSLSSLGVLHMRLGRYDSAVKLSARALDIQYERIRGALLFGEEHRRLDYAATMVGALDSAISAHLQGAPSHSRVAELALTTLMRRKGLVLDLGARSMARIRRSLPKEDLQLLDELSETRDRYAALSNRGPGLLPTQRFEEQLAAIQSEQRQLWRDIADRSPVVNALSNPVAIIDIQTVLPDNTVLLEYVRYVPKYQEEDPLIPVASRYAAYLVFPDRFDWVDLGPAEEIDLQVSVFSKALELKMTMSTDLHNMVIRPIAERLGDDFGHLIIAPDGDLNIIPFGAFYDGDRYLIEKYDIRYVTTGRDLLKPEQSTVTTTPITVVANPTGAVLTAAAHEANVLTDLFPDVRVFEGDEATETNVRTIERPLILHMATHGFFGEARHKLDNPMLRSGLELADVEEVEVDHELDDGRLTAYEVSGWDLRGTQLVVLSACETGLGALHMGEGVLGLRRAFAMAGAQTQVMSLWRVSDVTAQKVMEAYYLELAKGKGRGEAMQEVQLQMLRTKDRSHPTDWAAFIVTGDDDPLSFPAGQEPMVALEEGPPPVPPGGKGCSMAASPSERGAPWSSLFIGLLVATVLRRRWP